MDIAIALLPALFWGSMILFTVYIGGTAYSQILGITVGALLFASLNYLFSDPEITQKVFWVGLVSGIFLRCVKQNIGAGVIICKM